MKKVLHQITAAVMAILVLFSTLSFTINSHFCGDTLVDSTLFKEAKTCGMQMHEKDSSSKSMMDCCSNEQEHVEGQDELQLSVVDTLSLEQQLWVFSFTYTSYFFFEEKTPKKTILREYPPPLIVKRIYQLDETYLI
ncbi:HYC_CC_PP family protein [Spongiimicrobium salis]|uniref:HYC_CC_PP family protein n=1 Tax=Spongiimicrobium salis TaxID=1667022 RepID=UPI00374CA69A